MKIENSPLRARLPKVDLNSLTEAVIGAAFEVSNTLGAGFLEKLYERALVSELTPPNVRNRICVRAGEIETA